MKTDYTAYGSAPEKEEIQNETKNMKESQKGMIVNCRAVNLRKGPNKNAAVLGVLPVGTEVGIKNHSDKGWYSVFTDEFSKGYIMEEFVKEK